MNIPFLDLRAAYLELKPEIDAAVARVLDSGWYILGEEVEAFETAWARYCEAKHAVGVANGLDALHLALLALGVVAQAHGACQPRRCALRYRHHPGLLSRLGTAWHRARPGVECLRAAGRILALRPARPRTSRHDGLAPELPCCRRHDPTGRCHDVVRPARRRLRCCRRRVVRMTES